MVVHKIAVIANIRKKPTHSGTNASRSIDAKRSKGMALQVTARFSPTFSFTILSAIDLAKSSNLASSLLSDIF